MKLVYKIDYNSNTEEAFLQIIGLFTDDKIADEVERILSDKYVQSEEVAVNIFNSPGRLHFSQAVEIHELLKGVADEPK